MLQLIKHLGLLLVIKGDQSSKCLSFKKNSSKIEGRYEADGTCMANVFVC